MCLTMWIMGHGDNNQSSTLKILILYEGLQEAEKRKKLSNRIQFCNYPCANELFVTVYAIYS